MSLPAQQVVVQASFKKPPDPSSGHIIVFRDSLAKFTEILGLVAVGPGPCEFGGNDAQGPGSSSPGPSFRLPSPTESSGSGKRDQPVSSTGHRRWVPREASLEVAAQASQQRNGKPEISSRRPDPTRAGQKPTPLQRQKTVRTRPDRDRGKQDHAPPAPVAAVRCGLWRWHHPSPGGEKQAGAWSSGQKQRVSRARATSAVRVTRQGATAAVGNTATCQKGRGPNHQGPQGPGQCTPMGHGAGPQ